MRRLVLAHLLAAFALWGNLAHASLGLTELPGLQGDGPVTVFYPSDSPPATVQRGPFHFSLAEGGHPVPGNGRLVVITHGSGGAPWVHADLARTLVDAGFVVALPQHRGDHSRDMSAPGPESWKRRPAELSRAIDAVGQSAQFAPLLALDKVGAFGGSAGGHTVLSLAGGRWSPANFTKHCEAHIAEDFSSCVGYLTRLRGNVLDGVKTSVALMVIRQRFDETTWQTHHDPRIQAAVASVPFAADFDLASLARPRIPLGLIIADQDINQVPRFHVGAVRAVCQTCEVIAAFPTGGHGVMLSPLPPFKPGSIEEQLLADPPGFDRATLRDADRKIADFFRRHLLP